MFKYAAAIAAVTIAQLPSPATSRAQTGDVVRLAAVADSIAAARTANGVAGISVGVFRGTVPLLLRAYGQADVEAGTALTTETSLDIASITKQFTAAGILKLADEGKLGLDDAVTKYLPTLGAQFSAVTIRQLLNHTSGVGRYEQAFTTVPPSSSVAVTEAIATAPMEGAPGAKFSYNNASYVLLGRVIESVTGTAWDAWLGKTFFTPLGMTSTARCPDDRGGKPIGYLVANGRVRRAPLPFVLTDAAGGLCSTPTDLARWSVALHAGKILSPASYTAMTTPTPGSTSARGAYGMGAVVGAVAGHRVVWHNGALSSGYNGVLAYYPDDSITVIVLMNSYPAKPEEFGEALFKAWSGLPVSAPPVTSASATSSAALPLAAYVGTYVIGPLKFVVTADSAGLAMIDPNGGKMTLKPVAPNIFASDRDETFHVIFDVEGDKATQLRIDSPRAKAPPAKRVTSG